MVHLFPYQLALMLSFDYRHSVLDHMWYWSISWSFDQRRIVLALKQLRI